ncbi:MAG TPA: beta-hydroxyacyl-ACP dehydratase [Phycisphaerales bacterium]|nr:beta-hydroxyacyl-ACP dehydratase [Phycisphaerales bacterium]
MMRFSLIDNVMHCEAGRIVARKQVSSAEEYLADHFPGFPILPGVLMLEVMVQAARMMLEASHEGPWVLGEVRAVKYGAMVRPGQALEVDVTTSGPDEHGAFSCRGSGVVCGGIGDGDTAISGRFTMRPVRVLGAAAAKLQESETTCS